MRPSSSSREIASARISRSESSENALGIVVASFGRTLAGAHRGRQPQIGANPPLGRNRPFFAFGPVTFRRPCVLWRATPPPCPPTHDKSRRPQFWPPPPPPRPQRSSEDGHGGCVALHNTHGRRNV